MRTRILYHWSPKSRRKSILRYGLCPGKLSRCGQWRPPYLCFSDSPSLAWACSAEFNWSKEKHWDLWMMWSNVVDGGFEVLTLGRVRKYAHEPQEFRLYNERVPKSKIWHVGTRTCKARKKRK